MTTTANHETAGDQPAKALVSCIMPTANRRRFVPEAIRLFLAQDYAEKELIILDDGEDAVIDLIPNDRRIRYLRGRRREPVGAKRNRLCAEAKGELIAHWDDDDWYAPSRLSRQAAEIISGEADLCGLDRILFFDPATQRGFEYAYPAVGGRRLWLYGATLCYRKSLWQRYPFPEIAIGEDTLFVAALRSANVRAVEASEMYVGLIHPGNTGQKRTSEPAWLPQPLHRIGQIAGNWAEAPAGLDWRVPIKPLSAGPIATASASRVCVGVYVHSDPARLTETLAYLRASTAAPIDILLLGDGPDSATQAAMALLTRYSQSTTDTPRGASACFNRLLRASSADILVFLESGSIVGPRWLDLILAALEADSRNGLAGPTTNMAWNVQGAFRDKRANAANVAELADQVWTQFGRQWQTLEPLYCLADFCYAIRREVAEAVGGADEGYGLGPCWEMDYTVRAVRSGFKAIWAQGAYVFRHPFNPRRRRDEARLLEANKQRYQDAFCGLKLNGERAGYAKHCRGEACRDFAPADRIRRVIPIAAAEKASEPLLKAAPQASTPNSSGEAHPLVSCIMPTRDRPEWVQQSIDYFNRQSYENRELIIIDDGALDLSKYLPHDASIRYLRLDGRFSIGEKRNRACEVASGQVIVHWDDDDWYNADRLSAQMQPLLAGTADVTALADTLFLDLDQWKFWKCSAQLYARLFVQAVHGGTLMFRREIFGKAARYPNQSIAEDAWFLRAALASGARLQAVQGDGLFAYLRHGTNSWKLECGKEVDSNGWISCREPPEIEADRAFYARLSRAGRPFMK